MPTTRPHGRFQSRSGFSPYFDAAKARDDGVQVQVSIPFWVFSLLRLFGVDCDGDLHRYVSIPFWVFSLLRPLNDVAPLLVHEVSIPFWVFSLLRRRRS